MSTTKSALIPILTTSLSFIFAFGGGQAMAGADLDRIFYDHYQNHYE